MGVQPERRVLHKIIIYSTANIRSHESTWLFYKNHLHLCIGYWGEGGIGFVQGDADLAVKGSKPRSLCQCFSVGLCRWNHRRSWVSSTSEKSSLFCAELGCGEPKWEVPISQMRWSVAPRGSTEQACPWRVSPNWGRWQGQLWHHPSHVRREGCRCLLTGGRICSTLAREMWRGCSAKMHIGRVGVCRLAGLFWVWESHRSCLSSALRFPPLRGRRLSDQRRRGRGARGSGPGVGEHRGKVSGGIPTSVGLQRSVCCPSGASEG